MRADVRNQLAGLVLSLVRIVVGFLFALHGAATLFGVPPARGGVTAVFLSWPSWWAGIIELVGGVAVMLGIGTRPAAVICSGTMAYAYFVVHQSQGLFPLQNGGEAAVLFCWMFLLIAALGPGRYALGPLLSGKQPAHSEPAAD